MAQIQVLASHVADLIAAGEVVERPASVVKELMENAIDAGAGKITVEIAHGGLTYLRVTDDGRGIPPDELSTAFLRHATSKLRNSRDLEAISTLGFRGEALAAVAAVSRIEATSRTAGHDLGAGLSIEGGVAGEVAEVGCPLGTTMVVRDLFYNTPARLKFMKKDAAEGAAVFGAVQHLALSHPEVGVAFLRDGKQELLTPGDGTLKSTVYAVLGRELALGFIPITSSGDDMTVTGYVSLPACCRGSRNYQHFFVNGRYVKSRTMMAALEQAYQNQKMVGKFPGCVLHLEMKHSAVDVNVHPAKVEVKFVDERAVFSAVFHGVQAALAGDRTHPPAMGTQVGQQDTATSNQLQIKEKPPQEPGLKVGGFSYRAPAFSPRVGGTLWEGRHSPRPRGAVAGEGRGAGAEGQGEGMAVPDPDCPKDTADQADVPSALRREEPGLGVRFAPETAPPPISACSEAQLTAPEPEEPIPWRIAGEVLNTYIVVEQGETVLLIDKHAAHERMNFDRMKRQGYEPMSQTLITPAAVRLSAQEHEALLEQLPLLEEFGFGVEDFGGALLVRRAPFDVDIGAVDSVLSELAGKLLLTGSADPAAARDELLHTMACKAAIKGGWKTSPQELERVAEAVMSGAVKYCPHGRPVAIELTKYQIEKRFGRA